MFLRRPERINRNRGLVKAAIYLIFGLRPTRYSPNTGSGAGIGNCSMRCSITGTCTTDDVKGNKKARTTGLKEINQKERNSTYS